jgi:hypothetical protein
MESIEIWVQSLFELIWTSGVEGEIDRDDVPLEPFSKQVLIVAAELFSSEITSVAELKTAIAFSLELDVARITNDFHDLAKLCLIYAVSHKCPERSTYVQDIIGLEARVQAELMNHIKCGPNACLKEPLAGTDSCGSLRHEFGLSSAGTHDHEQPESPLNDHRTASSMTARKRKLTSGDEEIVCIVCVDKEKQINELHAAMKKAAEKEDTLVQEFSREKSAQVSKLMDAELMLLQKDESITNLNVEIKKLLEALAEQEEKLVKIKEYEIQVQHLHDDLDVLRPKALKVDALEAQTERLKQKLDEMSDTKQQLIKESAEHSKTHSKLVDATRELDSLRRTKAQLEEYRAQCAEYEITVNDLKLKLADVEFQLLDALNKNGSLAESQRTKLMETQHLSEELQAASQHLQQLERTGGIGEGMCELNPALMNELERLKAENSMLLTKIDGSSMESLERLEKNLDDQKCINSSLQSKWAATKDQLAKSSAEVASLSLNLRIMNEKYTLQTHVLAETRAHAEEDRMATQARASLNLENQEREHQQVMACTIESHLKAMAMIKGELSQCQTDLAETSQKLKESEDCCSGLRKDISANLTTIDGLRQKLVDTIADFEGKLTSLKENHSAAIDLLKENEKRRIEELEAKYKANLMAMEIEVTSLSSEVDDERLKRKRVEKEKRFLDSEIHRYKTQVQINSSNGQGTIKDIATVLEELKSMQSQLDVANEEISRLRANQNNHAVASAAPTAEGGATGYSLRDRALQRPKRVRLGELEAQTMVGLSSSNLGDIMEQKDLNDKRIEVLAREKRELIAKNLEENQEKMDLAQRLLQMERENKQLKSKVTKLTLDNERFERKLLLTQDKVKGSISRPVNDENIL